MTLFRSIISVIVGYCIFALATFALFQLSGQAPHEEAPPAFMLISTVFGAVFALLGGYVAATLARGRPLAHGIAVAVVLALVAVISLVSTFGKGAIWSQIVALVLMAPSAALGGWLRAGRIQLL